MAAPGDKIVVLEKARATFSIPIKAGDLPDKMVCPGGHDAEKYTIKIKANDIPIPCYVCRSCQVIYRYHECSKIRAEVLEFSRK